MVAGSALNLVFIVLVAFKVLLLVQHLRFASAYGVAFSRALEGERSSRVMGAHGPGVLPAFSRLRLQGILERPAFVGAKMSRLGYKENLVHIWAEQKLAVGGVWQYLQAHAAIAFVNIVDIKFLVPATGLLVTLQSVGLIESSAPASAWFLVAALQIVGAILCVSVTVAFARYGSQAAVQEAPVQFVNGLVRSDFLVEVRMLVLLALVIVYIDSVTLVLLANTTLANLGAPSLAGLSGLFNCAYHVCLTMIFSTQLQPTGWLGEVFVLLVSVHAVLLVLVGAAALTGATKVRRD